jgi:ribonuclease R
VLHGDKVMVRVAGLDRRGRREGKIVEVLEHVNTHSSAATTSSTASAS